MIKHKGDGTFCILILLNWQIFMCKKRDLSLWGKKTDDSVIIIYVRIYSKKTDNSVKLSMGDLP